MTPCFLKPLVQFFGKIICSTFRIPSKLDQLSSVPLLPPGPSHHCHPPGLLCHKCPSRVLCFCYCPSACFNRAASVAPLKRIRLCHRSSQDTVFAQTLQWLHLSVSQIQSAYSGLQGLHDLRTPTSPALSPAVPIVILPTRPASSVFLVCASHGPALEQGSEPRSLRCQSLFLNLN